MNRRTLPFSRSTQLALFLICTGGLVLAGCAREPRFSVSRLWNSNPDERHASDRGAAFADNARNRPAEKPAAAAKHSHQARPAAVGRSIEQLAAAGRNNAGRVRMVGHQESAQDPFLSESQSSKRAAQRPSAWSEELPTQARRQTAAADTRQRREAPSNAPAANDEWDWSKAFAEAAAANEPPAARDSELRRRVMAPSETESRRDRWDWGETAAAPAPAQPQQTETRTMAEPTQPAYARNAAARRDASVQRPAPAASAPSFSDNGMVVESSEVAWRFPNAGGKRPATAANTGRSLDSAPRYGEFKPVESTLPTSSGGNEVAGWKPVQELGVTHVAANRPAEVNHHGHDLVSLASLSATDDDSSDSSNPFRKVNPLHAATFDAPAPKPPALDDQDEPALNTGVAPGVRVLDDLPDWEVGADSRFEQKTTGRRTPLLFGLGLGIVGLLGWGIRRRMQSSGK